MYPESWQEWPRSSLLGDEDIVVIRAEMPFGPISLREAEVFAAAHQVHPLTILNIAAGRSYRRPRACPEGHPLRLALNAEAAVDQRLRYQAQKHRQAVVDAQDWKCRYCGADVFGKGRSALDHIVPVAAGGTSEPDNLQVLYRRCNVRKSDRSADSQPEDYLARKQAIDRVHSIADTLLWPDSRSADCPRCTGGTADTVMVYEDAYDGNVFECSSCRRIFWSGGWMDQSSFLSSVGSAMFSHHETSLFDPSLRKAALDGDHARLVKLVQAEIGGVVEVVRHKHTHGSQDRGCWCEFGGSEFEAINDATL